jgi:hypothetical protein
MQAVQHICSDDAMLKNKRSIVTRAGASAFASLAYAGAVQIILMMIFTGCAKITAPADIFPPVTPAGFTLLGGGDGEAHFRWARNTEADFDKYKLYRAAATPTGFRNLVELRQTEYVDRFLDYDTTYFYYLTALDFTGNESAPSRIIDVQPLNVSAPAPPANLLVAGRNNPAQSQVEILLSWIPPNISDVALFRIFRSATSDFNAEASTLFDSSSTGTYRDRNVKPDDLFYYKVVAVDRGGKTSLPSSFNSDRVLFSPGLSTPANRTRFTPPLIFSWSAVEHAAAYQAFVGRGPMSDIIWSSKTINQEILYNGPALSANTIYYWWVGAFSKGFAAEVNSFSEVWTFFVQ